ncbi:hypothetical protein [Pontibacter oryzae]|uniref:Glycosyltransferase family 1 protein n=1 Tax=Pontibacter oryzae TaxID=2304593 RepID=A0A399SHC2_9BACT|nr:hypothetical protein [Pontibacter oryzae]RIJ41462.1 hypothetical protein D1627_05325 [Pontibacter oryzae]
MAVTLSSDSVIYIACPAREVTGGPEAMHQLFYKLTCLGYNAQLYYFPGNTKDPVPPRYQQYKPTFVTKIEDNAKHVLIVPEVSTFLLSTYKHIQKAIWWLSVDNYFASLALERNRSGFSALKRLITLKRHFRLDDTQANQHYHFAQSTYAYTFLENRGIANLYYLSDYLNASYFEGYTRQKKHDQVLYNPKKGIENTRVLIEASPEITWIPIENMTVPEVKQLLAKSKVYVDFGAHPGKDRFPREAVMNECCVITGRDGSANFQEDVPILDKYKFQHVASSSTEIINLIKQCFTHFETLTQDFDLYRKRVLQEEKHFEHEIISIFKKQEI